MHQEPVSHTPLQHSYLQTLHANPHLSAPVATVQTLTTLPLKSQAETASELISILNFVYHTTSSDDGGYMNSHLFRRSSCFLSVTPP